jgi:putative hemolysin
VGRPGDPSQPIIIGHKTLPTAHIIDLLIAERAPKLSQSPIWPLIRAGVNRLLDYDQAVAMADTIAPLDGQQAMAAVSQLLQLEITTTGLEHIPRLGRCIIIANHPTGIGDGIAAWDAIKTMRPDLMFYANADAHRVCTGFDTVLIAVEWELHKRTREKTRETLRQTQAALEAEKALFIFPAGKLARRVRGVLIEPEWMTSAVTLARKNNAPIIPVHMSGPDSFWFHLFNRFSSELRDITLFKELLNKKGRRFTLTIGAPFLPADLAGDANDVTNMLQRHVGEMGLASGANVRG